MTSCRSSHPVSSFNARALCLSGTHTSSGTLQLHHKHSQGTHRAHASKVCASHGSHASSKVQTLGYQSSNQSVTCRVFGVNRRLYLRFRGYPAHYVCCTSPAHHIMYPAHHTRQCSCENWHRFKGQAWQSPCLSLQNQRLRPPPCTSSSKSSSSFMIPVLFT